VCERNKYRSIGIGMNKTKVDDILIEMITPKVKEIEEKFGNGGRFNVG